MKKALFVCIHNSARSPMAEAFLNALGPVFDYVITVCDEASTERCSGGQRWANAPQESRNTK